MPVVLVDDIAMILHTYAWKLHDCCCVSPFAPTCQPQLLPHQHSDRHPEFLCLSVGIHVSIYSDLQNINTRMASYWRWHPKTGLVSNHELIKWTLRLPVELPISWHHFRIGRHFYHAPSAHPPAYLEKPMPAHGSKVSRRLWDERSCHEVETFGCPNCRNLDLRMGLVSSNCGWEILHTRRF